jgi:hypothetical protein
VKIDLRTRLEAWNTANNEGRRGEAATPYPSFGRPVTYIQDHIDDSWLPLIVTPPNPAYIWGEI